MAGQSPYGDYTLLFNLKVDENETTNLAKHNAPKVEELRALIKDGEGQAASSMADPRRHLEQLWRGVHRADLITRCRSWRVSRRAPTLADRTGC